LAMAMILLFLKPGWLRRIVRAGRALDGRRS
jgi:hypothetical protein